MAKDSIDYSTTCFSIILNAVEQLPSKARREANVAEVHALSTYGLGVIALHRGEYEKSRDLLRESRLRAKGCEFDDLVTSSELELQKLDNILAEIAKGEKNPKYEPPSMDVLFLKPDNKDDPVNIKPPLDESA
ncbi:hypothetical protein AWJ20_4426 [Sugiyamaella lignohabitans]|uniref:Uncharacterized protein n=1 Tax=Sugiyamaella lignohabitans TaxID=796027 RepID=A0A167CF29_9ASCO|nr:uncharacterized protein AWJ20_4426 [Sugiyamaella lignohabitans]ANB11605.1 hypothetical protein AWJ20_4426 [Sugiyamaella lignohabitans]